MMRIGTLLVAGPLCAAALSGTAHADVYCGATNPNHDAPWGYLVTSRSQGIVAPVITRLGEVRTHTMLSNGDWFTHAGLKTPPKSTDAPHLGPSQLRYGDPGASQISTAAAYVYLYAPGNGGLDQYTWGDPEGTREFVRKQDGGIDGQHVADFFWWGMGFRWVPLRTGLQAGGGYYRLLDGNGADIPYSLHQYVNIQDLNTCIGPLHASGLCSTAAEGVVCSTLLAFGSRNSGRNVDAFQYSSSKTVDAAWDLHLRVWGDCVNGVSWFDAGLAWFFDVDVNAKCREAANQVLNCFLNPSACSSSANSNLPTSCAPITVSPCISKYGYCIPGATPVTIYPCSGGTVPGARSISPDTLSGWRPGQDWQRVEGNAPWANALGDSYLHFSGGGTTYSCWGNG